MKDEVYKDNIRDLLMGEERPKMTEREIASALRLRGKSRKRLQKWLREMISEGEIVPFRGNRFTVGEDADLVSGRLNVLRSGKAVVSGQDYRDGVFVSQEDQGTALPGDTVVVRLYSETSGRLPEGRVVRIVERGRREVVGTIKKTGRFYYVVPIDPAYRQDIYVPDAADANLGDRVVVRFDSWDNRHVSPEGEITHVIGPPDNPSTDTESLVYHYGIRREFPEPVLREAETVAEEVDRPGQRVDLRDKFILTIDPETARDFDDALSLEKDSDGNRVLGVHIADVAHFVRPGSELDKEAALRGNSVYFPDKVIPMLPEQLSNGSCSLRPDEDHLAFSAFLTVDGRGQVLKRSFCRSIIRSQQRLTYEQAMAALDGQEVQVKDRKGRASRLPKRTISQLQQLHRLAQQFRKLRYRKYALDLEVPESEIVLDETSAMVGIRAVHHDYSHQLVEECMVAANEAVATFLHESGVKSIARLHEPPDEERIEELTAELIGMGYEPGNLNQPRNLANFLKSLDGDPLAHHARISVLKSMKRAVYSADGTGHFGLAKQFYTHFTSPIRRYTDLIIHRQLADLLSSRRSPRYIRRALATIARNCSETERTAEEAERACLEIKKLRFLQQQIDRDETVSYEAVIVKVLNFGFFAEVIDLQIQGLVHISTISDHFVRFNKQRETLRADKQLYRTGMHVNVKVCKVDFDSRKVDFVLSERS